jgi:tetratricopeptide (TPR) repeat protein
VAFSRAPARSAAPSAEERAALEDALRDTAWNISRAAERLGITRNAIRYRIEKYGLTPEAMSPRRGGRPPASVPVAPPPRPAAAETPATELRRLTFLRVHFASRADSQVVTAGRIDETLLDKIAMFGGTPAPVPADDDLVAVFGLTPVEDGPRRAANAALTAQREVARDETGVVTALIHVASVPIQRLGTDIEVEAGAAQEVASGLDAMMRELARPGIFVTEATAPFLQRRFDLARAASNLYRLVGPERARLGEGTGGRLATFVGRQQELHFLTDRFAAAARGHGEIVGVAGAAGLGKSRLLIELRQALQGSGATVLEGHCASHGAAMAYLPIREVVRGALGIAEGDGFHEVERTIRAGLIDLGLPEAEATPLLLHFLGLDEAEPPAVSLGPEVVRARTFEIVRGLLLARSRRQPLVLAIEDLHWIDRTSEDLLAALADSVAGAPVLLVTTYRPGYQPVWMGRSYATQIALQPLTPDDGARVVRSLLGENAVEESVIQLIIERAEGNPFFLEELAREVREQGGRALSPKVPETVEAVLLARLDRLPPADRQLLQAAAVVGRTVPGFLLNAVTSLGQEERRAGLKRLRAAEFLYEQAEGSDAAHVFSHVLTQEVASQSLPADDRGRLHARIAEALEGLEPARQVQYVERLAHHCLRGRLWAKAVTYNRQAGHRALARSAYRESAQCFEQALEAVRGLPEGRDTLELGIDLRCELRTVLFPLGRHERILNELHTAQGLAERLGDKPRLTRVLAYLADGLRLRGDHERALECGQRALALVQEHGDLALQVAVNNYLGQICYDLGQYARASCFFAANVERLVGGLSQDRLGLPFLSSVHSRTWLVFCLSELGDFGVALRRAQEAVELAKSADHPFSLTSAFAGLGRVHLRRGQLDDALPALETAWELSRRWNIGLWAPILGSVLGYAYALRGRLREGILLLEQGVEQQERIKQLTGHALRMATLGEAYLLDGQVAAARALAPRVLALAREQKERGHEAYALHLVARAVAAGDPDSAEPHYDAAISLTRELGMRPLLARCLLDLGRAHLGRGARQPARDALTAAVSLLGEMDMGIWRREAETSLAAL